MWNWAARGLMLRILVFAALWTGDRALAHDNWANGRPIPSWVKSACCGPKDVHQPDLADLSEQSDGSWTLRIPDGFITYQSNQVFSSQDGEIWAFYDPDLGPQYHYGYCLFLPLNY